MMISIFISEIGEKTYNGIIYTQTHKLGHNHRKGEHHPGQSILFGGENLGVQQDGRNKTKGYSKIGNKSILNTLAYYYSQGNNYD